MMSINVLWKFNLCKTEFLYFIPRLLFPYVNAPKTLTTTLSCRKMNSNNRTSDLVINNYKDDEVTRTFSIKKISREHRENPVNCIICMYNM